MPSSGDVVDLDPGGPEGRKAGFRHPEVIVPAQQILEVRGNIGGAALPQIRETLAVLFDIP